MYFIEPQCFLVGLPLPVAYVLCGTALATTLAGRFWPCGPLGMPSPVILPEKPISPMFWQPAHYGSGKQHPESNHTRTDENDEYVLSSRPEPDIGLLDLLIY